LKYLRNHWLALNEYVTDGRLPIDNNWVERLMKTVTPDYPGTTRVFAGYNCDSIEYFCSA
jgi:hypothetical protein